MTHWQKFCAHLLKKMGWTVDYGAAPEEKCVILGVPHTSIGDFFVSYLYYTGIGHTAHIMIKKEFFFWPVGPLLKKVGCIPVDRSNGATVVRSVISAAEESKGEFHICIAPEGTRKPVHKWKTGYHLIAKALNCPVYLGYFDWKTKHIGRGERFDTSDNAREDTEKIQAHYEAKGYTARHPEKFCTH
ncbi:MAG: 1-acyl-sn-glycerol-3-phosphate acyltransferase [Bacteroidales bacterium]|nr:1-acyl-sn-glycerol-3-phosphate acyltransferase [Bacteroidales bacterium]